MAGGRTDGAIAFAGALLFGGAAAYWFGTQPAMAVLVGTEPVEHFVPAHYQASVFPAFGAMVALLAADMLRGKNRASWGGLFLAALLTHEAASRGRAGHFALWLLAVPALLITTWYKLVVWHDTLWFTVSIAAGAAVGILCHRLWKTPPRAKERQ
ncbi:MAG: hypothetical protein ACOC1F_02300 [Myxococcota bacterium]